MKFTETRPLQFRARAIPAKALAAAAILAATPLMAAEEAEKLLLTQPLDGLPGKVAMIVEISAPPGFETPNHLHPGHMFLYVVEGAVEILVEGQPPTWLQAGDAVYETPNMPMVGRNASTTEGARLLVIAIADDGAPLTVPVE